MVFSTSDSTSWWICPKWHPNFKIYRASLESRCLIRPLISDMRDLKTVAHTSTSRTHPMALLYPTHALRDRHAPLRFRTEGRKPAHERVSRCIGGVSFHVAPHRQRRSTARSVARSLRCRLRLQTLSWFRRKPPAMHNITFFAVLERD